MKMECMQITLEIENEEDLYLILTFAKRAGIKILEKDSLQSKSLEELSEEEKISNLSLLERMKQFVDFYSNKESEINLFITPDKPILNFSEYIREREISKPMSKKEFLDEVEKW